MLRGIATRPGDIVVSGAMTDSIASSGLATTREVGTFALGAGVGRQLSGIFIETGMPVVAVVLYLGKVLALDGRRTWAVTVGVGTAHCSTGVSGYVFQAFQDWHLGVRAIEIPYCTQNREGSMIGEYLIGRCIKVQIMQPRFATRYSRTNPPLRVWFD